jgi:iron complex transport system substrate-binding protein
VTVFNQRSIEEIWQMLWQVAALVDARERGVALMTSMRQGMQRMLDASPASGRRPRIYFEEWDEPPMSAIRWVSELMCVAGGDDCFPELAQEPMGKQRIIADGAQIVARAPDIILGSWCGKKFRPEKVAARAGWADVPAVRHAQLFEIKSPDILQPGPAALTDGVRQMHQIFLRWMDADLAGAFKP